ncbi:MAG: hypothetical protein KIT69_01215 [Propionibacteriaceae bacterium]|nr:hypothetical protein [Propionibacteriaceae bacterium]
MRWLRSRLRLRPGRTLVAIDGLPGAGKTCFADELAALVADCGVETVRISLDDYGLTADATDESLKAFLEDVIEPLASIGSGRYRMASCDETDRHRWACAADQAVVLVDGRYLHRSPFHTSSDDRVWDLSVWLEVPMDEALRRQRTNPADGGPREDSLQRQQQYLRECEPATRADLVVDNRRPHLPID